MGTKDLGGCKSFASERKCFVRDIKALMVSYDAISSFPFSLECYKLIVDR